MKNRLLPQLNLINRQRKVPLDLPALEAFAHRALPLCAAEAGTGLTKLPEVNVVLVSDRRISQLHRRFMQIEGATDVITFQHGEIFISVETARRQARTHGTTFLQELRLYLVHGLLHLQGFDDTEEKARQQMHLRQEAILRGLA